MLDQPHLDERHDEVERGRLQEAAARRDVAQRHPSAPLRGEDVQDRLGAGDRLDPGHGALAEWDLPCLYSAVRSIAAPCNCKSSYIVRRDDNEGQSDEYTSGAHNLQVS